MGTELVIVIAVVAILSIAIKAWGKFKLSKMNDRELAERDRDFWKHSIDNRGNPYRKEANRRSRRANK